MYSNAHNMIVVARKIVSMDINPSMPARGPSIGQGGPKFRDPCGPNISGGIHILHYIWIGGLGGPKKGGPFFWDNPQKSQLNVIIASLRSELRNLVVCQCSTVQCSAAERSAITSYSVIKFWASRRYGPPSPNLCSLWDGGPYIYGRYNYGDQRLHFFRGGDSYQKEGGWGRNFATSTGHTTRPSSPLPRCGCIVERPALLLLAIYLNMMNVVAVTYTVMVTRVILTPT